jgi:hypothetical protein
MSGGQLARSGGVVAPAGSAPARSQISVAIDSRFTVLVSGRRSSTVQHLSRPSEPGPARTAIWFDDHGAVTFDESEEFDWDVEEWEAIPEAPVVRRLIPTSWRIVGALAALSMLVIPLLNVIDARTPQVADNGLEVCRFDYCVVERHIVDAGLGMTMAEMSARIVPDSDVQSFVDAMLDVVGGPDVRAEVVDELPGDLGGRYSQASRLIQIDRPATVWVIAHEVAHTVSSGHDDEFQETLADLARFFDDNAR